MSLPAKVLLTITTTSQRVPCPAQWLRERDAELQPYRDDSGRRLYDEGHVERARQLRRRRTAGTAP